ncbi:MAG TPA: hypothetical protein DCS15_00315 [Flavobacteriales bacterium]|nr:hypothetical protein [Flavobacteriales bacterium]
MQRLLAPLLFVCFFCSVAFASKNQVDSNYIKDFTQQYTFKLFGIQKYTRLHITEKFGDLTHSFYPNEQTDLGFGFNYKWLGVALTVDPNRSRNVETLGETKKLDLQLFSYGRKFGFDVNISRYQGFYLNNPDELGVKWDRVHYPLRPDINTNHTEFNWFYVRNHEKFSYRAAFTQNEEQKKTAGSLIFGAFAGNTGIRSVLGLQTILLEDLVNNTQQLRGGNFNFIGGGAGYAGTLTHKGGFYGTLSFFVGLSSQSSALERLNGEKINEFRLRSRSNTRLSLGYNHKAFFAGVSGIIVNRVLHNGQFYEVENETGQFRFFVGRRFNWRPIHISVPLLDRT